MLRNDALTYGQQYKYLKFNVQVDYVPIRWLGCQEWLKEATLQAQTTNVDYKVLNLILPQVFSTIVIWPIVTTR
jgi:hypothetical protein